MTLEAVGPLSWIYKLKKGYASPPICFRDAYWYIRLPETCLGLHLNLTRDDRYLLFAVDTPFSVSVQVEDGTGRILPDLCNRRDGVNSYGGCIWWQWKKDIKRVYPEFKNCYNLTFRITIEETNPQTGTQTRCSLTDACTQTEGPKLNTVNYFTSNCIPSNSSTTDASTDDTSINNSKTLTPLSTSTSPCLIRLSEDIAKLLDEESYPDVEFHCEDFSAKAHRNVVSTRSPVLARMLKSDMVEGKTGIVEIKDMDADTFKQFFRYLYSGKLEELTFDAAMPLYEAADQYEVHVLASRCSEFISKNLSGDNAYKVLIMADAHSDLKFVEVVVEYMLMHKFPLSGDRWSKFSDDQPRLANKVLNQFCQMWATNYLQC